MSGAPTGTADYDAAVEAVLQVMDGHIERASNRVGDWPEDEADLHRNGDWRSFTERAQDLSRLRARKIVDAVLSSIIAPGPTDEQIARVRDLMDADPEVQRAVEELGNPERARVTTPGGPDA